MNRDNGGRKASDLVSRVFSQIGLSKNDDAPDNSGSIEILNTWNQIVSAVEPDGERLAAHSRVLDLKNGVLQIETDHPGWIQIFQFNKIYLLNRLQRLFPNLEINSLSFRLNGNSGENNRKIPEMTRAQRLEELERRLSGQILPGSADLRENEENPAEKVRGYVEKEENSRTAVPKSVLEEGPLADALQKLKKSLMEKDGEK